jgi:hypothetical protein
MVRRGVVVYRMIGKPLRLLEILCKLAHVDGVGRSQGLGSDHVSITGSEEDAMVLADCFCCDPEWLILEARGMDIVF